MMRFRVFVLLLATLQSCYGSDIGNNFTLRQQDVIDHEVTRVLTNGTRSMVVLAKAGVPITPEMINVTLNNGGKSGDSIITRETSDFAIIELIRIMILSGNHSEQIIPIIEQINYWMYVGNSLNVYWSENHMVMWMSCSQLLHEHFGWDLPDGNHRIRLVKILEDKRDFGYYEFWSTTYFRLTLSGLLNLYDFSMDAEIKSLAEAAVNRMVRDLMLVTTSKGTFFPTSGRSGNGAMLSPYQSSAQKCIYVLTGLGEIPEKVDGGSAFLATTTMNLTAAINSYSEDTVSTTEQVGLSFEQMDIEYAGQDEWDKVVFQWSQGGYFYPDSNIAVETFSMIKHFDMWDSRFFKDYKPFNWFPSSGAGLIASILEGITTSSLLFGEAVIFKHKNAQMSSMQDYFPGKKGYQQHPYMATTGLNTIFTQGGPPDPDWGERPELTLNPTLPAVKQVENVALVLYNPHPDLGMLVGLKGINLYFPDEDFNETREIGRWLLGREDETYVAVYRECTDIMTVTTTITGSIRHCVGDHQVWAVMVGDEELHGSFDNFSYIVGNGTVSRISTGRCVTGIVIVDGKTIRNELCSPLLGGVGTLILVMVLLILSNCVCCFVCCRKKRRVWKKVHAGTKENVQKAVTKIKQKLGRDESLPKAIAKPPEL